MTESNFTNDPFLGLVDYHQALRFQSELHDQVSQNPEKIYLLGLEHPTIITLGRRVDAENSQVLTGKAQIPVLRTSRGGLATLHSPGQLVIYPILNLQEQNLSVRDYVHLLLVTTKELLAELGLNSELSLENAGVFTKYGKIAFCGVEIKNRITKHGISLNVSNDLQLFRHIIPCGFALQSLDRVVDHGINAETGDLFGRWSRLFRKKFASF